MNAMAIGAALCAALAAGAPVLAQQSVGLGSISGRVADPSGAVIAGARVTARQAQTNTTVTAETNDEGRFRFAYLRVGPYEITVVHKGFRAGTQHVTVTAGAAFELPLTLQVSGIDTSVTVTADAGVLEAARSQIASTVPEAEVRRLPMSGRQFLELALLVPGVSPANVSSTQLFPETSAVPGITLSIASQRNLSNNFIVDGLSANDDAAGLSGMTFGIDAIEQFQVITSGAQAELGRALGGYVNVVTKSGTNTFGGSVYHFARHHRLNAKNPLLQATLPMHQAQYGGSAGGPLSADRTFYFVNLEQRRLDQTGLATIGAGNARAINEHLAAVGYQGPPVVTGTYANPVDSTNVLGKIDHRLGSRAHLWARYSLYDVAAANARGAGGLSAPSASSHLDNRDQAFALANTLTLSPNTVLEMRGQFAHGDLQAPAADQIGPAVTIAGVASFGASASSPTGRLNRLYQAVNNVSHHAGAHAIQLGADFLYNRDRITFPRARRGSYTFASLGNFLAGVYNNSGFTQTFGSREVSQVNPNVGLYVQDEWKVGSSVTLNLGVRYDLQFLETIDTDTNNVSPRIGVAWSPFASRRTIARANAGIFYDRVPLRALANALLSAGNTTDPANLRQIGVSLSPSQAGAPAFPAVLADAVPSVTLVNLTTMDRELQNARSTQASLEIDQVLWRGVTLGASYQFLRGAGLLMAINQNVPTCVASGANNGCRPNPAYANHTQYSSAGSSRYQGLHLSLTQRPAAWGHYRVSYTLSTSENNLGEFFFSSPIDPFDVSKDWGRSDSDQRHRLVVSGAIVAHGFDMSATMQAYSALPLNITSGVTSIQGTAGRPLVNGPTPSPLDVRNATFIPRNAGVGSNYRTLNARLSRTFHAGGRVRIEALVEGFNLTNHRNVVTRNANFGPGAYPANSSSTFGQITAVGEPRALQVGARLRF